MIFHRFIIFIIVLMCGACNLKVTPLKVDYAKKEATSFTKGKNDALYNVLPFESEVDFINAQKGFIATLKSGEIKGASDNMVYNIKQFNFLKENVPATANPSLWRQGQLNQLNGLFKVTEGIYQVRNFDLANMTLIEGKTGWIIIDPLTTAETAKAGLQLANQKLGKRKVSAVIITHSHIDHFGGIHGVVNKSDSSNNEIPIYVPGEFFEHAISENILGGNAMARRASYMFGTLLSKDVQGNIGAGLGQTVANGTSGIIDGTHIINNLEGEQKNIDGINFEFLYTPEAEAPAEMIFYLPGFKAFCQAEEINHNLHNLYTPRGAQVRNGQKWSKYIDKAIQKWGNEVEISFGCHHWPTWGNTAILKFWEQQRDLYRFIHDQTLRLANHGYTPTEIAEMIHLPLSLDTTFANRGYYGTVSHNVKAQYQLYFGWFDGNPANLNQLPPADKAKKYVNAMGGVDKTLNTAKAAYDKGEYRWMAELVNHVIFVAPQNKSARSLLADAYEQMGYAAESGPWRNFYLTGAKELREGVKQLPTPNTFNADMIRGMTTELYFNYIAMRFNGMDKEAAAMDYQFNITLPDVAQKVALIIKNGVLTPRMDNVHKSNITSTITLNREDLNKIALGQSNFQELIQQGQIRIEGDQKAFIYFLEKIDSFDFWFNISEP